MNLPQFSGTANAKSEEIAAAKERRDRKEEAGGKPLKRLEEYGSEARLTLLKQGVNETARRE